MYHVSAQGVDERMINVLFSFLFNIKLVPWSSSTYMYQTRFCPDLLQTGHAVVTVSDQLFHKGHGVRLAVSHNPKCRTSNYTTVTVSDKGRTSDLIQDIPSVVLFFFFFFFFPQVHHCGAFIQKQSSIITIFLSLIHSRSFLMSSVSASIP